MRGRRVSLSHATLAAFIRNESDAQAKALIEKLKHEEPAYQTLFELIAECRAQTSLDTHTSTRDYPQTAIDLEELLLRLYADDAGPEEAGQFLEGLMASPIFYQRVLIKLEALAPHSMWSEAAQLEDHVVKSEAEVLDIIRQEAHTPTPVPQRRPTRVRLWLENFGEDVRDITAQAAIGASAWQALTTLIAGIMQGIAHALDFMLQHRVVAFATPILLFAAVFLLHEQHQQEFLQSFVYDGNVPYGYHSGLRGGPSGAQPEAVTVFQHDFALAMSDYMLRRYASTLQSLEKLEPTLPALQNQLGTQDYAALLSDYYFYSGVSHLALAQSQMAPPPAAQKAEHLSQAITFLERADSLAQSHQLQESDREAYFLGIAYGFSGKPRDALAKLQRISTESEYYPQSARLIAKWSQ